MISEEMADRSPPVPGLPETGDASSFPLWLFLMMISFMKLAGLAGQRKRLTGQGNSYIIT